MQLSSFWQYVFDFSFLGAILVVPTFQGVLAVDLLALLIGEKQKWDWVSRKSKKVWKCVFWSWKYTDQILIKYADGIVL